MASKRMFSMQILDTDAFLDMPLSAQALYIHLNMRADDDGMVDNTKRIMKIVGANQNDLDILIAKRFIIVFSSGVIVIKHWLIHNTIRKDRKKATVYHKELSQIKIDNNKAYTEAQPINFTVLGNGEKIKGLIEPSQPLDNQMTTTCQPNDRIDIGLDLDIGLEKENIIKEKKRKET